MSVEFYNQNASDFFSTTVNADMSETIKIFIDNLSEKTGEILDLGCGSGRDSKHFLQLGYKVTSIDLSPALAKKASQYIGQDVIVADMREIDFTDRFIGIWACASLLHLTEAEILETLKRCYKALKIDGTLYASFKLRENNYEKENRKFTCFTREKFLNLIKESEFYSKIIFETGDVRRLREGEIWLNIILKKN
ncbi:MAG: class I SAM-dependent methyltransferase [Cetobacterium sp.]